MSRPISFIKSGSSGGGGEGGKGGEGGLEDTSEEQGESKRKDEGSLAVGMSRCTLSV